MVGGELTLESLDLATRDAGFYRAPVQTVANGGVLVIDDFGRQQCTPRELLNRWIVPLESRVDFLTLQPAVRRSSCHSTCWWCSRPTCSPAQLVDEAFLRRIQYKIFAREPDASEFVAIFENCCRERGVAFDSGGRGSSAADWHRARNIPLRGCQPRDLIKHALALAEYLDRPRALTPDLMDGACHGLFRPRGVVGSGARLMNECRSLALPVAVAAGWALAAAVGRGPRRPLAIRITSPLGRTGLTGPIRSVAQSNGRDEAPV